MAAFRGPKVWLWRWRRNPLRRRSDALEAWVVLVAWAVTVLGGVFTGLAATQAVEHGLAQERAEWRSVAARLTEDARDEGATESGGDLVWAKVRWTAADGSSRAGQARVFAGTVAGTSVTVWTDPDGRLVTRPATASQARLRASLVGVLVGVSAAGVPFVCGRLLRGRLERRRMEQWDQEWERIGPLWGRKTS
ncbi:Rv1733c family protein [Streptomyces lutosisoli]|uniref:Integral membrane protein n=1 Tax=Streptomyces lutosisoli TaxID=2665721 RepID=A0ABW2VSE3_9ACTN